MAHLSRPGYDVAVIHDYRNSDLDIGPLTRYRELIVIGWSMGVIYAEEFLAKRRWQLPITRTLAINGSPWPRHDTLGIPTDIYDATASINDRRALERFYRRTCGSASAMARLMPQLPDTTADEAAEELKAITAHVEARNNRAADVWDEIIISANDLIFPKDNLLRAWNDCADRITIVDNGAHCPDFQSVINRYATDKQLVAIRFDSAADTYDRNATVQHRAADRLSAMIPPASGIDVIEVGAGTGWLTHLYQQAIANSRITTIDLAPTTIEAINGNSITSLQGDAETMIMTMTDQSADMIVSSSTMQWFNSPRRFLREVARVLRPGGSAYLSTYVSGTFSALQRIAPDHALPYPSIYSDGFGHIADADIAITIETTELQFPNASDALRHIRATGVNATSATPLTTAATRRLMAEITHDDHTASLDFTIAYITITKHS